MVDASKTLTREFVVPTDAVDRELFCAVAGRWLDASLLGPDGETIASGGTTSNVVEHGGGCL